MSDNSENKEKFSPLILGYHTGKDHYSGICEPLSIDGGQLTKEGFRPAAQIFTQVPKTAQPINMESPAEILRNLRKLDMHMIIHSPYVINGFWNTGNMYKFNGSLINAEKFVYEERKEENKYFCGLIVHLPKKTPEQVVKVFKKREHPSVKVLLENHAHTPGDDSYELPDKLNNLTELLIHDNVPNWGYCIDTAHLFVCISEVDRKKYKFENRDSMEMWLSELSDETRGRIGAWHLNGSVNEASSHKDEHAILLFGDDHLSDYHIRDKIWGDFLMKNEIKKSGLEKVFDEQIEKLSKSSLVPILKHAMSYNIPVILEINRGNENDTLSCIKILKGLEKQIRNNPNF